MQTDRYSRQIRFEPIGVAGQRLLAERYALVAGCGALGSVSADLLARAGVGRLTLIDRDFVELSNLQRQTLYDEGDAVEGLPKSVAAMRRLQKVNSGIEIRGIVDDLRSRNAEELLSGADLIVDATDNFETRYLINDFAVKHGVPWVYGAAIGSYGISMPILPGEAACFRCVYPEMPAGAQPTCETAGVLSMTTTMVASLQAAFAIQFLSGNASDIRRKITTLDVWSGPFREIDLPPRDAECPCCGLRQFPWLEGDLDAPVSLCGRDAVQIHSQRGPVDLAELDLRLRAFGQVRGNAFAIRFANEPYEITVFHDGRAIIKGTTDIALARSLYARWIGS